MTTAQWIVEGPSLRQCSHGNPFGRKMAPRGGVAPRLSKRPSLESACASSTGTRDRPFLIDGAAGAGRARWWWGRVAGSAPGATRLCPGRARVGILGPHTPVPGVPHAPAPGMRVDDDPRLPAVRTAESEGGTTNPGRVWVPDLRRAVTTAPRHYVGTAWRRHGSAQPRQHGAQQGGLSTSVDTSTTSARHRKGPLNQPGTGHGAVSARGRGRAWRRVAHLARYLDGVAGPERLGGSAVWGPVAARA